MYVLCLFGDVKDMKHVILLITPYNICACRSIRGIPPNTVWSSSTMRFPKFTERLCMSELSGTCRTDAPTTKTRSASNFQTVQSRNGKLRHGFCKYHQIQCILKHFEDISSTPMGVLLCNVEDVEDRKNLQYTQDWRIVVSFLYRGKLRTPVESQPWLGC